jgi:hypothetical protein
MKWNAIVAGFLGFVIVSDLVYGTRRHSFDGPYYLVTLGCLLFAFTVKMWQLSKYNSTEKKADDELLRQMRELAKPGADGSGLNTDVRVAAAIAILVEALVRLDATSSRLAGIYINLTIALGVIGIVQIVGMLLPWFEESH